MTDDDVLLSVRNLKKHYPVTQGILSKEVGRVRAVDGISFDLRRGETLGIVGESGCGKSTAATSLIRLEEPTSGEVVFNSKNAEPVGDLAEGEPNPNDVTTFDGPRLKKFRREAQMIFQDPSSSFDPRMTIGESVAEPLRVHGFDDKKGRRTIVQNLLERVGLSASDYDRYPHEFSGGQKQRIALARALVVNPEMIVADEPVSALDVSVQAEILSLIKEIQDEFGLSILFISHDMGVIREVCDRVAVMYLGEIVELAETEALFDNPQHPYTEALLSSIPIPDPTRRREGIELSGDVPSPSNPPSGCRFHTRCPRVIQPEGYDFDQEAWRGVMDLRQQIAKRDVDTAAAREFAASTGDQELGDVSNDELSAVLRDEFSIPETLSDSRAESVLAEALDHLSGGDPAAADDLLSEEFSTVCEESKPEFAETEAGHPASCHLHDGRQATVNKQFVGTDD